MKINVYKFFSDLKPFLGLSKNFRLYLLTALLAGLMSEGLLMIQPMFVRGLIDHFSVVSDKTVLLIFPIFMIAVGVIANIFNFISVSVRFLLARKIESELKSSFITHSVLEYEQDLEFALREGIRNLSDFILHATLDFFVFSARVMTILLFIYIESMRIGALSAITLLACAAISMYFTFKVGEISQSKENATSNFLKFDRYDQRTKVLDYLNKSVNFDFRRFFSESVLFFITYYCFQLLPALLLFYFIGGAEISVGVVASLVIYFSLLRGPYVEIMETAKNSSRFFAESALFREELLRCMKIDEILDHATTGIIWLPYDKFGVGLSEFEAKKGWGRREYYDDLGSRSTEERVKLFSDLRLFSKNQSVIIRSDDPFVWQIAHYVVENGELKTVLSKIKNKDSLKKITEKGICLLNSQVENFGKKTIPCGDFVLFGATK